MGEKCEHCWTTFRSHKYLLYHQKIAKYCQRYRYTMFTCCKCLYSTKGINNIDLHNQNCKSMAKPVEDPIAELQKRVAELEEENSAYKAKLTILKEKLETEEKLSVQICLERFKNKIYRHLIEQNTSIRVGDILIEKEDGIHVYNVQGGSIPVFVHEYIRGEEGLSVTQQIMDVRKNVKKVVFKHKA